ncbi:hypothetical protein N7492_008362 [Penicillium capsulatum]|uniref:Uncharacterized protein n=1 Tax=Penicillium capsulatum TaxID=69766 RepID=A0A9W9HSI2_9EURO|nr:hypothetical protein N7492_008362 [Penicillium capsulatum]KAJ6105764.1 hypothetical protein N7512_009281 [Penicillium capsulatum]
MAWYSILPPYLNEFEVWAVRVFFLLGLITIVPWGVLILFDAGFYLYRMILWEFPWIGGRARGHQRPRAPSLNERPDGQRRAFRLRGVELDTSDGHAGRAGEEKPPAQDGQASKENGAPGPEPRAHSRGDGDVKRRLPARA